MERIPLETQTLYAELLDQLTLLEAHRSIGSVKGGFTTKTNRGQTYCYFQYSEPGGVRRQIYLGRESQVLTRMIEHWEDQRELIHSDLESVRRLCRQLRVGGAIVTSHAHARVLEGLADAGVFRMGGVLVGTHAFAALGNLLGVRWDRGGLATLGVDIASERTMDLVLPEQGGADLPKAQERLKMGFLPVPALNPKEVSTSFKVRKSQLKVDVLTPTKRRSEEYQAVRLPAFNATARALNYLDYLIEAPQPAAIVNGGGIWVNVPDPARYALHKTIIAQQRPVSEHVKSNKDLRQAALLLEVLAIERPDDLDVAWEALAARGRSWETRSKRGLKMICERTEGVHSWVKDKCR